MPLRVASGKEPFLLVPCTSFMSLERSYAPRTRGQGLAPNPKWNVVVPYRWLLMPRLRSIRVGGFLFVCFLVRGSRFRILTPDS